MKQKFNVILLGDVWDFLNDSEINRDPGSESDNQRNPEIFIVGDDKQCVPEGQRRSRNDEECK